MSSGFTCTFCLGSLLEGGGQVLRNSMSYAALLQQSIRIANIRAGRDPPIGLRAQHLTGLQVVHTITGKQIHKYNIDMAGILVFSFD